MSDQDKCCGESQPHPDYSHVLPRLNRIGGQVDGIKKMVEGRRYCPDILAQLRAVRSALMAVEAGILETHLDACVAEAFASGSDEARQAKMAELKDLYRRFNG